MTGSTEDRLIVLALLIVLVACGVLLDNGLATAFVRAHMYDYLCFHGAAVGLLRGLNYYDPAIAAELATEFGFERFLNVYPPLSSALFVPLALLPWEVARRIWTAISLIALIVFVRLLGGWFLRDLDDGPARKLWGAVGLLLLFSFYSLGHAFQVGQTTMVNAALIMGVLTLAARGHDARGGWLLALTVFFKPTAVILVFYALLKRRWRLLGWSLAGIAILGLLSLLVLGVGIHQAFVDQMLFYFDRVDPGVNYQDFPSFWARLFAWPSHAPFEGNEHLVKPLTRVTMAVLLIPVIVLLARRRWEEMPPRAHLAEFGLLLTAVLLSQNQSAIHAYFLLAMPMAAAAMYLRDLRPGGRSFWLQAGALAGAWCLVALPFGFREEALWHGLLIVAASSKLYGGLLLWALLLWIVWAGPADDRLPARATAGETEVA